MSEQTELTYILGAGASYQSIPVVNTFPFRFNKFTGFIGYCKNDDNEVFGSVYEYCQKLSNDFLSHQSFDTYFKKLFHTNNIKEIQKGKKILHLYFIWEHLSDLDNPELSLKSQFIKTAKIDKRYDALIAGLLSPEIGQLKTFCKINFITWNYDLNLFFSIKNYFSPDSNIGAFYKDIVVNEFEWNINNQISVYNMNGYFYSKFFQLKDSLSSLKTLDLIKQKVNKDYLQVLTEDKDAELIKFAWETNNTKSFENLTNSINRSANIVVIGYTFPLYNRLIDLKYFSSESLNAKRLYIQDPNSINIVEDIKDNFGVKEKATYIGDTMTKTTSIENCQSFFVPNSIYRI